VQFEIRRAGSRMIDPQRHSRRSTCGLDLFALHRRIDDLSWSKQNGQPRCVGLEASDRRRGFQVDHEQRWTYGGLLPVESVLQTDMQHIWVDFESGLQCDANVVGPQSAPESLGLIGIVLVEN